MANRENVHTASQRFARPKMPSLTVSFKKIGRHSPSTRQLAHCVVIFPNLCCKTNIVAKGPNLTTFGGNKNPGSHFNPQIRVIWWPT